jgi:hypothetical protein
MKHSALVFVAAAIAGGCGKKADPVPDERAASVNALVPASLKDKLVFAERKIKDGPYVYVLPAPRAWKGFMIWLGPDDASTTSLMVVYKCASEPCKSMDWNVEIDRILHEEAGIQKDRVEKDERTPTSRTIFAEHDGQSVVLHAKWTDGSDHYLWCEVHLDKPLAAARAAFEKACQLAEVDD